MHEHSRFDAELSGTLSLSLPHLALSNNYFEQTPQGFSKQHHVQAAALAEFRADWATAVKTYQSAYAEIARITIGSEFLIQRAFEIAAVAEQVHIKVRFLVSHINLILSVCLSVHWMS